MTQEHDGAFFGKLALSAGYIVAIAIATPLYFSSLMGPLEALTNDSLAEKLFLGAVLFMIVVGILAVFFPKIMFLISLAAVVAYALVMHEPAAKLVAVVLAPGAPPAVALLLWWLADERRVISTS